MSRHARDRRAGDGALHPAGQQGPVIRRRFGVAGAAFVDISRGDRRERRWIGPTRWSGPSRNARRPTASAQVIDEDAAEGVPRSWTMPAGSPSRSRRSPSASTTGRAMSAACWSMNSMVREAEATVGAARDAVAARSACLMAELQKSAGNLSNALTRRGERAERRSGGAWRRPTQSTGDPPRRSSTRRRGGHPAHAGDQQECRRRHRQPAGPSTDAAPGHDPEAGSAGLAAAAAVVAAGRRWRATAGAQAVLPLAWCRLEAELRVRVAGPALRAQRRRRDGKPANAPEDQALARH